MKNMLSTTLLTSRLMFSSPFIPLTTALHSNKQYLSVFTENAKFHFSYQSISSTYGGTYLQASRSIGFTFTP